MQQQIVLIFSSYTQGIHSSAVERHWECFQLSVFTAISHAEHTVC